MADELRFSFCTLTGVACLERKLNTRFDEFSIAAFFVEATTWSQPVSYGVLLDAYRKPDNVLSQGDKATFLLSLAGVTQSGIIYCSAPLQADYDAVHGV